MSQRRLHCSAERKTLEAMRLRISLMRGYRRMARINRTIAEETVAADNDALSAAEQKLTECETK